MLSGSRILGSDINGQSLAGSERTSKNNCHKTFNKARSFKDLECCLSTKVQNEDYKLMAKSSNKHVLLGQVCVGLQSV